MNDEPKADLTDRIAQVIAEHQFEVYMIGGDPDNCAYCCLCDLNTEINPSHHPAHVAAAIVAELGLRLRTGQGPYANHIWYQTDWTADE